MQEKTNTLSDKAKEAGLNINTENQDKTNATVLGERIFINAVEVED